MTTHIPWLTLLIVIPAGAAILLQLVPRRLTAVVKGVTLLATAAGAVIVGLLLAWMPGNKASTGPIPLHFEETHAWLPAINASYHLGIDGVSGWLLALNVWIAAAATRRLVSGVSEVHGLPVLIVSAIAAVVMLAGALIVGADVEDADGKEDLNIKAVLLDTAADGGAAAGVAVTGAIIFVSGRWNWLDPAVALVIAVVIGYHAGGLIWHVLGALGIRTHPKRHTNTT